MDEQPAYNVMIEELKHSLKLYIQFTGGIDQSVGYMAMKLIDVIEMIRDGKDPSEDLNAMSYTLIKILADSTSAHIKNVGTEGAENFSAVMDKTILEAPDNPFAIKSHYLKQLSLGVRKLSIIKDSEYPPITNLAGEEV